MLRAFSSIALLLGPAVATYSAGYAEVAYYVALGTVLSFNLGLLARPLASFAVLIPAVYAAAALTAHSSDGVAALIVAVAAAVGAASSQGFHRGLLSVLAAALIGSFEPAASADVIARSSAMLLGAGYGILIVMTVARAVEIRNRAVHPQTALSYATLLAVLTLIAWFAARFAAFEHGWWLPLAVAAIGEPSLAETAERAVSKAAVALCATVPLLAVIDSVTSPVARAAVLLALVVPLLVTGPRRPMLQAFLLTPIVVLVASHPPAHADGLQYLGQTLVACAVVFTFSVLSKWVLWTLRPDTGRVSA